MAVFHLASSIHFPSMKMVRLKIRGNTKCFCQNLHRFSEKYSVQNSFATNFNIPIQSKARQTFAQCQKIFSKNGKLRSIWMAAKLFQSILKSPTIPQLEQPKNIF